MIPPNLHTNKNQDESAKIKQKNKKRQKLNQPVQLSPSPENPMLQAHVKLPSVLEHAAFESHLEREHSSTSKGIKI